MFRPLIIHAHKCRGKVFTHETVTGEIIGDGKNTRGDPPMMMVLVYKECFED